MLGRFCPPRYWRTSCRSEAGEAVIESSRRALRKFSYKGHKSDQSPEFSAVICRLDDRTMSGRPGEPEAHSVPRRLPCSHDKRQGSTLGQPSDSRIGEMCLGCDVEGCLGDYPDPKVYKFMNSSQVTNSRHAPDRGSVKDIREARRLDRLPGLER